MPSSTSPGPMTAEREMLRQAARDFAMQEVLPLANRLDPEKADMPRALSDKQAELGYFGITIAEEHGGLGLGCFEYCLIAEELSRAWMSVGSIIARGNTFMGSQLFSAEQRAAIMPRVARGEYLGALALSEPGTGSDLASVSCRARRDGDGWVINGNKTWCTFADGADFIFLLARSRPEVDPQRKHVGISAFLIDKPRDSFPPGLAGSAIPKIGYFGWKTWELAFDGMRLPATALIGNEGEAFAAFSRGLETYRAHTAARAIGLARGALEDATQYAQERVQFDQPIANFQAIRFKLAHMATQIEAARQLNYHVCTQIDQGLRCDTEAAMSKLFASEMSERVCSDALQILGGAGYTTQHAVERYWRDARLTKIFEGTSEIQLKIISDRMLGKVRP
ncbi:MAG: acyl-CoA dehydrogenase family protein [Rhodoferax sp.]|nr:acyl-CoA dehydrogenase family protein [Rhodoferax sp.]